MSDFGEYGEPQYVALIGDVVSSRQIEDRAGLQHSLIAELEVMNAAWGDEIAAPLVLISGDEVQGLFSDPSAVVPIVVHIEEALWPVKLLYGVGRGRLATELSRETTRLDGRCFHLARGALESAQKRRRWLHANGLGTEADAMVGSAFDLMSAVRTRWTARQLEFVRAARTASQSEVASRFGVSPSVVSESLKAASYKTIVGAEKALSEFLSVFGINTEFD